MPARKVSLKANDLFNRPLTRRQTAVLENLAKVADAEIDYSDIPPLTDAQLDAMFKGRFFRPAKQR